MKHEIELKYYKGGVVTGSAIVNSMAPLRHYTVERPNSILYRPYDLDKKYVGQLELPGHYTFPMDYSRDSGKHAVPADSAVSFLNIIKQIIVESGDRFYLRKNDFLKFLNDLQHAGYLSEAQAQEYSESIPTEYTIEDMMQDAKKNQDASLALDVASRHKEELFGSPIYWLMEAKKYEPDHPFFQTSESIQQFLMGITTIRINFLFNQGATSYWLLDELAKNESIEKIDFGTHFYPRFCINEHFTYYLSKACHLKVVDVGAVWSADDRMYPRDAAYLARGLEHNTSVEELNVTDQHIGDEGLYKIIEALRNNKENKLVKLNLFCSGITEAGAQEVLKYIQEDNSLTWVNLRYNRQISQSTIDAINNIAENKVAAQKATNETTTKLTAPGENSLFASDATIQHGEASHEELDYSNGPV